MPPKGKDFIPRYELAGAGYNNTIPITPLGYYFNQGCPNDLSDHESIVGLNNGMMPTNRRTLCNSTSIPEKRTLIR